MRKSNKVEYLAKVIIHIYFQNVKNKIIQIFVFQFNVVSFKTSHLYMRRKYKPTFVIIMCPINVQNIEIKSL